MGRKLSNIIFKLEPLVSYLDTNIEAIAVSFLMGNPLTVIFVLDFFEKEFGTSPNEIKAQIEECFLTHLIN